MRSQGPWSKELGDSEQSKGSKSRFTSKIFEAQREIQYKWKPIIKNKLHNKNVTDAECSTSHPRRAIRPQKAGLDGES
jgi:hypothetical protein